MSADARRIEELLRRIAAGENSGNARDIVDLLADDAVLMAPNYPVQEGKTACAAFVTSVITDLFAHFDRRIRCVSAEVQVFGDHALDRGSYSLTVAPRSGGAVSRATGRYLFLYSRSADDAWQLARAIVNQDTPDEAKAYVALVALLVREYDPAIAFFTNVLGFELSEDSASLTNDGRPKRWVVVRPPGGDTGMLLARADGDDQRALVGKQFAGRVGMFLRVDDFSAAHTRLVAANVTIVSGPRRESYGDVLVFLDLEGNRWDLVGPATESAKENR